MTKSFLLMLPKTISWNFKGEASLEFPSVGSVFFCPILQSSCLDFFWISPISQFCLKFPRVKVTNLKNLGIFFEKVCPWPLPPPPSPPIPQLVWIFTGMGNSGKKDGGLKRQTSFSRDFSQQLFCIHFWMAPLITTISKKWKYREL